MLGVVGTMSGDIPRNGKASISISGNATALAIANNDSLASVLRESGMQMRDFIVLSFVSDQGPIAGKSLARLVAIDLESTLLCIRGLVDAGFLEVRDDPSNPAENDVMATAQGNRVAQRILGQISAQ